MLVAAEADRFGDGEVMYVLTVGGWVIVEGAVATMEVGDDGLAARKETPLDLLTGVWSRDLLC
jgi:hypothetical protein